MRKKRNCKDCLYRHNAVCRAKNEFVHHQKDEYCDSYKSRTVLLCYEENRHQLARECGAIEKLQAFGSVSKAVQWVLDRVKEGTDDGYIVDKEYGEVARDRLFEEILEGGIDITLFNGYQENWDVSYDIIAQKVEVEE